tara:strand:- start:419 stop:1606 length:1188 start_codon:yes stop_codon:yes gene_type:complete
MNKKKLLTIMLFSISVVSFGQFTEINTGFTGNLFDTYFSSDSLGYVVGGDATQSIIFKTTDGGASWNSYTNSNTSWLYGVNFVDDSTGYVCGNSGVVYKTIDGGQNWSQLITGTTEWIMSIHFVNENVGYCVGNNGLIMKTTNGGTTWVQQTSNTNTWLLSTFFTGVNEGYAVGVNGTALKTVDGGSTWSSFSPNTSNTLSDVFFLDDSTGFCTGFNGTLIKTIDYGNTWQILNTNTVEHLQSVNFFNANYGYAVGNGSTILSTQDGGTTWGAEIAPTNIDLNEVFMTGSNIIIAGDSGRILTEQLVLNTQDILTFQNIMLYPNPTSDFVNLELGTNYSNIVVEVRNLLGQTMLYRNYQKNEPLNIDLSGLSTATYLVNVFIDETSSYSFKVLKK